jgi:hypothetical protein
MSGKGVEVGMGVIVGSGVGELVIVAVGGAGVGDTVGVVVACIDGPQAVAITMDTKTIENNRDITILRLNILSLL